MYMDENDRRTSPSKEDLILNLVAEHSVFLQAIYDYVYFSCALF